MLSRVKTGYNTQKLNLKVSNRRILKDMNSTSYRHAANCVDSATKLARIIHPYFITSNMQQKWWPEKNTKLTEQPVEPADKQFAQTVHHTSCRYLLSNRSRDRHINRRNIARFNAGM